MRYESALVADGVGSFGAWNATGGSEKTEDGRVLISVKRRTAAASINLPATQYVASVWWSRTVCLDVLKIGRKSCTRTSWALPVFMSIVGFTALCAHFPIASDDGASCCCSAPFRTSVPMQSTDYLAPPPGPELRHLRSGICHGAQMTRRPARRRA